MVGLRGHHLICLHFFNGEGYNEEFINNLKSTLRSAAADGIKVTSGVDDICGSCPYQKDTYCRHTDNADNEICAMDRTALKLLHVSPGDRVTWEDILRALPKIFPEWYHSNCTECDWKGACENSALFEEMKRSEYNL